MVFFTLTWYFTKAIISFLLEVHGPFCKIVMEKSVLGELLTKELTMLIMLCDYNYNCNNLDHTSNYNLHT